MQSETLPPPPVLKYDTRSAVAAGLCLMALFFNALGWLLAIAGIILLRRAVFPAKIKWILASIALAPKILFMGIRVLRAPQGLSFTVEPGTLANSAALWSWSVLLAGVGVLIMFAPVKSRGPVEAAAKPERTRSPLLKIAGTALIAGAAVMLLGLTDDFQRIEDAGNGRWALKHDVRGAVATFTNDELASIEAVDRRTRGSQSYPVRVKLTSGRTYSVSTQSSAALKELRTFASTAGLRPGAVRISRRIGGDWTNDASGFTPGKVTGIYESVDERGQQHSTFEFWLQDGRLAGKETFMDSQGKHVQSLRDIKLSDTGEVEFQQASYAAASKPSESTVAFSLRWSGQGETGRFTKDGLELGVRKYRKQ